MQYEVVRERRRGCLPRPVAMLTDLVMPGRTDEHGSGGQTVRLLRERSPDTPVVALCDGGHHTDCIACSEINAVFTRPPAVEEFLKTVGGLLTGRDG